MCGVAIYIRATLKMQAVFDWGSGQKFRRRVVGAEISEPLYEVVIKVKVGTGPQRRPMRSSYLLIVALLLSTLSCGFEHAHCENNLLKRSSSPGGNLVLATYHRECTSMIYTMATVEKPAKFLQSEGEVICYLMLWRGRHPVEAVWKTANEIFITTTDRLEVSDFQESKPSCDAIKVNYSVQFRNEQPKTNDPEVISKMKKVLSEVGPCINKYYQAAYPSNDPAAEVDRLINNGEHRSALELLLGYTSDAKCPISPATYQNLKELSEAFDLKPEYLESVRPFVQR